MTNIDAHLTEAIHSAASYLFSQIKDNGEFIYRINMDASKKIKQKYNWLRHAGTLYALISYLNKYERPDFEGQLQLAVNYFIYTAIFPLKEPGCTAVWTIYEKGNEKKYRKPKVAKLGGAGLGLLALLTYEKKYPETIEKDLLTGLGNFICYMQNTDGSFYSKYITYKGGRYDQWVSLYYPGEAALGLVYLYEYSKEIKWLKAAENALMYLAQKRKTQLEVEHDHWALIATERIFRHKSLLNKDTHGSLIHHTIQICESIISWQIKDPEDINLKGSFDELARTTPTSTRMEGLLSALNILEDTEHQSLKKNIINCIELGSDFLLRSQIKEGRFAGAITRAFPYINDETDTISNPRGLEIRIDYIQHFLSAMLEYQKIITMPVNRY